MTKQQRKGLGRGLGALLSDKPEDQTEVSVIKEVGSTELSVDSIETNPFQPRSTFDQEALQELAESIRVQGIIQPITVRELAPGKYQLISGERRLQASRLASLKSIPAYIRTANDQQMLEMALIENIQRENLNALEIALSYQRLMQECDLKQEELGDRVGKNRTTVNNYLRLLKLPATVQAGLKDKSLSMGHARALLGLEDEKAIERLYRRVIDEQLSVRRVEELVRSFSEVAQPPKASKKASEIKREILDLQERMATWFGTKVLIKADTQSKGEVKIPFKTKEELDQILAKLRK